MVESRKGPRHVERAEPAALKAEPATSKAEPAASMREEPAARSAEETEQLILTLNAETHEVVRIEKLEDAGHRRRLSEQDFAALTGEDDIDELLSAVQEAYEAGIAEGLGTDNDEDSADEDAVLWHFLRQRSVGRQLLRGSLRRTLLRRLLLRRLLRRRVVRTATAQQQRRKPIAQETRNGSASA